MARRRKFTVSGMLGLSVFFACCGWSFGQARLNLRLSNTSTPIARGEYKWIVYVDADQWVLDQINYVEYYLHPAFDHPDRKVEWPRKGPQAFSTSDIAFRPAKIRVTIHFYGGSKQSFDYTLRLRSSFTNTWYVVVGYYGANQSNEAKELAKAYKAGGFQASAVDTNSGDYPNFDRGVYMVVMGPSSRSRADALRKRVPTLAGRPYIQQAARE